MADKFTDGGDVPVCSAWLNRVDDLVFDVFDQSDTAQEAREAIDAVEEAPEDGITYGRRNRDWIEVASGAGPSGDAILRVPTSANVNSITTNGNPTFVPLAIQMDVSQSADAVTVTKAGSSNPLVRVTQDGDIETDGVIRSGRDVSATGQSFLTSGVDARVGVGRVNNTNSNMLILESDIVDGAGRRLLRYFPAKSDNAESDEPLLEQEYRPQYPGAVLSRGWQLRTKLATFGWAGNLVLGHGPITSESPAILGYWSMRPGEIGLTRALYFLWGSGVPSGGTSTEGYIDGRPPFRIEDNGDCTVGRDMYVQDLIYAGSLVLSDLRLKADIAPLPSALDVIDALNPVSFTWKKDGRPDTGLIAQEVQKVLPDLVKEKGDYLHVDYTKPDLVKEKGDYLHVDYTKLISYLVKAVQELKHGATST
jgi:hypothetical protein